MCAHGVEPVSLDLGLVSDCKIGYRLQRNSDHSLGSHNSVAQTWYDSGAETVPFDNGCQHRGCYVARY